MLHTPLFTGCATALITPMRSGGGIDEEALRRLVRMQLEAHIDALVVLGTTGEPCTLDMRERERVIAVVLEDCKGKVPVLVGTGSNDTRRAAEYARQAHNLGADGQLCVTPYYNKATQDGLLRHYEAVLNAAELPMILYHVPGRTGMRMLPETVAALAVHPLVAGLKDASGDLLEAASLIERTSGALPLYSGCDDLTPQLMSMGALGSISVLANVAPERTREVTGLCLAGDFPAAWDRHLALMPLIRALFSQVNPIPVKAALSMMGLCKDELRLPLTPMEEPYRSRLRDTLRRMGLLAAE